MVGGGFNWIMRGVQLNNEGVELDNEGVAGVDKNEEMIFI